MPTLTKILAILLLFFGEAAAIYMESFAAKNYTSFQFFSLFTLKIFLLVILSGGCLVAAYILGYRVFKNIWVVAVSSITAILIIEPILIYLFFRQLPSTGSWIGLVLGAVGFVATLVL